jgi:ubiquinone/menaquinone biosynthesis C-methylase UbiE
MAERRSVTEYLDFAADWSNPDAVDAYDEVSLWSSLAGRLMLDNVPLRAGMTVLDVGCGTGFPLLELAQRLGPDARAVGVDPWRRALGRAALKRRVWAVRQASLIAGDAVALPFRDASFDRIASNLGLNNFADPAAAVQECARVLKRDGHIAITTNLQGHMLEFYDVFEAVLQDAGMDIALRQLDGHVRHRTTVEGVRELFAGAGVAECRIVEEAATLRFADGSAFPPPLRHEGRIHGRMEGSSARRSARCCVLRTGSPPQRRRRPRRRVTPHRPPGVHRGRTRASLALALHP